MKVQSEQGRVCLAESEVHLLELHSKEGTETKRIPPKITQVNHRAKPAHMSKWCQTETGSNRKPPKPLEACPFGALRPSTKCSSPQHSNTQCGLCSCSVQAAQLSGRSTHKMTQIVGREV